jgi:adenine-specific DNA-methyltransferase
MKNGKKTRVESLKHKDKRTNIPTEELRDFVVEDERKPKTVTLPGLLYARDPSLDPQLVWKGKDEQDRQALEVPAVPIYIQEKIHPHALIEDLRAEAKKNGQGESLSLFADFNGIKFEDLVDFYTHKEGVNWSNRLILGDSLLVMTSLAEKEGLKGKVQMIYMDPPYGIKFGSNWQVSTRKRDVKDGKVEDASREPEVVKAFRDTWEHGIHSYLSYLRDRLVAARELLTETGSVFVQIGDENVHLVRNLMDEVFGSENFHALIVYRKTSPLGSEGLAGVTDYIVWYAKDVSAMKFRPLYAGKEAGGGGRYSWIEFSDGARRRMSKEERENLSHLPNGARVFVPDKATSAGLTPSCVFPIVFEGHTYHPHPSSSWSSNKPGMDKLRAAGRLMAPADNLSFVRYHEDFPVQSLYNLWEDTTTGGFNDPKVYAVQTVTKVIERCLLMATDPGDLVLDPTCGSGTTAFVAEQWGRRWITCDTSRVALALARTRMMAAKYPYYLLADSPEGVRREAELTGSLPSEYKTEGDIRKGFVYERVPHVTLKSIANNPDIREGMTREQIDAAIARHADTETLFDQPYEDSKRLRVCGPFTVESLSPHRVLSGEEEKPASERDSQTGGGAGQFETMILDNLRKAGVQNTVKNERLKFERLEPYAGVWIHAAGDYIENGKTKRVAVSIGPEHGTVGPDLVKEAAKEAVQGVGFDLLLVCGFAFDPHVSEEAKRYGKLNVVTTRMNPDLSMGDELLKKTGAGNLFMIFGEPDIDLKKAKDGKLTAEIKGVDVYDPTTGQIRSHSTDDIACWFIDTNYNGESFFVRHAYFTGADEPYEKLKRALRAEIDEGAWSALYSTKSRPFDPPKTGKIAVKVINHYGDEVLKIYSV